jgi:hypothetical protein
LSLAAAAFATYLNDLHKLIHPQFADKFLKSLSKRSNDNLLNNATLMTRVELVIDGKTGVLLQAAVVSSSGVSEFDEGAVRSIELSAPFPPAPVEIQSPDGNVYLHWELFRNPDYACSAYFMHPYILKNAPLPSCRTAPPPAP